MTSQRWRMPKMTNVPVLRDCGNMKVTHKFMNMFHLYLPASRSNSLHSLEQKTAERCSQQYWGTHTASHARFSHLCSHHAAPSAGPTSLKQTDGRRLPAVRGPRYTNKCKQSLWQEPPHIMLLIHRIILHHRRHSHPHPHLQNILEKSSVNMISFLSL